jgi:hypothetical protein
MAQGYKDTIYLTFSTYVGILVVINADEVNDIFQVYPRPDNTSSLITFIDNLLHFLDNLAMEFCKFYFMILMG